MHIVLISTLLHSLTLIDSMNRLETLCNVAKARDSSHYETVMVREHDRSLPALNLSPDEIWLQSNSKYPLYVPSACNMFSAVYIRHKVYLTITDFESPAKPLKMKKSRLQPPATEAIVTAAQFLGSSLFLIINGRVYSSHISHSDPHFTHTSGITKGVTSLFTKQCCQDNQDKMHVCSVISQMVVAYNESDTRDFFLSTDGGASFRLEKFDADTSPSTWAHGMAFSLAFADLSTLFINETSAWFVDYKVDRNLRTPVHRSSSFPGHYPTSRQSQVFQPKGFGIFIVASHFLMYSMFHGKSLSKVICWNCEDNVFVFNKGETVRHFTSEKNGNMIFITSSNRVIFGKDGIPFTVIVLNASHLIEPNDVITVDGMQMKVWRPKAVSPSLATSLWLLHKDYSLPMLANVSMQQQCPFKFFSSNMSSKVYIIDKGESLILESIIIPQPWVQSGMRLMLSLSNPMFSSRSTVKKRQLPGGLVVSEMISLISQSEELRLHNIDYYGPHEGGHTQVSIVAVDSGSTFVCSRSSYIVSSVQARCPPSKNLRVRRPNSDVICQERFDYKYTILGKHRRQNGEEPSGDIVVSYDRASFGCPLKAYYIDKYIPVIDIYDGNTFIKELDVDYVIHEIHGLNTYKFTMTQKEAGCQQPAQTWQFMLGRQNKSNSSTAWTRQNYRSCHDTSVVDTHLYPTQASETYEILNSNLNNGIKWDEQNYIYVFEVIALTRDISYCDLRTTFAVEIYGATPQSDIPTLNVFGIATSAMLVIFYIIYLLNLNQHRRAHAMEQSYRRKAIVLNAAEKHVKEQQAHNANPTRITVTHPSPTKTKE